MPTTRAPTRRPSSKLTVTLPPPATTCSSVRMSPLVSKTTPAPSSCEDWVVGGTWKWLPKPGNPGDGREARDIRNAGEAEPGHANLRGGDDVDHARAVLPADLVHGRPKRGGDEGTRDPLAADAFDHRFRPVGCAACGYHERGQSADDRACEHSERLSTALAHIRFDGLHLVVGDRAPRGRDH